MKAPTLHFYSIIQEKLLKEARDLLFPEELISGASPEQLFEMIKDHHFNMQLQTEAMLSSAPSYFILEA